MSKIANDLMFDILPIVIQSDRKKRNVEDEKETHVYDSENNHHAVFKRSLNTNTETNDVIDYMVVDGKFILCFSEKFTLIYLFFLLLTKKKIYKRKSKTKLSKNLVSFLFFSKLSCL